MKQADCISLYKSNKLFSFVEACKKIGITKITNFELLSCLTTALNDCFLFNDCEFVLNQMGKERLESEKMEWLFYQKGLLYESMQRFEQSKLQLQKALEINSNAAPAKLLLAKVSLFLGEREESLRLLLELVKKESLSGEVWFTLANTYALLNDYVASLNAIEKCLSIDPDYPEGAKKREDIITCLSVLQEIDAQDKKRLIFNMIDLSKIDLTFSSYLALRQIPIESLTDYQRFIAGDICSSICLFDEALFYFSGVNKSNIPNDYLTYYFLHEGTFYYYWGKLELAKKRFEQSVFNHPKESDAYEKLAEVYLIEGDFESAIHYYLSGLKKEGDADYIYLELARAYAALRKYETALKVLKNIKETYKDIQELKEDLVTALKIQSS